MQEEMIEALVTEAEPKMFPQMLGTADADFYGHQTNHGSFVFGGATGMDRTVSGSIRHRLSFWQKKPIIFFMKEHRSVRILAILIFITVPQ